MRLTDAQIATAQIGLSYFFLAGFFAAIAAEGLGYLKAGTAERLTEGALLILFFWFQRLRQSEPQPPKETP
jgi:hypothetical protein